MSKFGAVVWPVWLMILFLYGTVSSHVDEGTGATLQFYSYYTSTPPKINGCLVDATTAEGSQGSLLTGDNDEWKNAYIRRIQLQNPVTPSETIYTTFFFMNDGTYLYVGCTGDLNNLGNNNVIQLYFDQGTTGGNHNDVLNGGGAGSNNGEYRAEIMTDSQIKGEYSFNGTAWQQHGSTAFTAVAQNFGTSFFQGEFKIRLNGNPAAGDGVSYLNVTGTQELGIFLQVYTTNGGGKNFNWTQTNRDINNAATSPGWCDLRLGITRSYVTLYATANANGNPTIDGNINGGTTPDDAWRGAYSRNLVLTNFAGSTINAVFYSVENAAADNIYIGLKVHDNDCHNGDFCQIYQEQDNATTTGRNFLLDDDRENALIADTNAYTGADDRYWEVTTETWAQDGSSAGQNAIGKRYGTYYEYEYLVSRSNGGQDLILNDGALMGFLVRYHDADDNTDYYWEYSPNRDNIEIDPNNNVFVATGWPDLQLGAPYVQVIFPEDGSNVEGVVHVRIYAEDEEGAGATGIDSALFYLASGRLSRTDLTRIAGTQEWAGTLDVGSLANGEDTLVIVVGDNDGIVIERLVEIDIQNGTGTVVAPSARITSPTPGSTLSGTQTITFTKNAGSGTVIRTLTVYIDGDSIALDSSLTGYSWNTTSKTDGSHTVQVKVINDAGMSGISPVVTYITSNAPTVTLSSPTGGAEVSGKVVLSYTATAKGTAVIDSIWLLLDGAFIKSLALGGTDTLNTTTLVDGEHTLLVRARDNTGKIGSSEIITVAVRNTPLVTITSPTGGAEVSGKVVLSYAATAKGTAAIDSIWLLLDGKFSKSLASGGIDTLNTTTLADGEHTLLIRAEDNTGKTGSSEIITVVVRNMPSVTITSPIGGAEVSGKVVLSYTATAKGTAAIDSIWLLLDGNFSKSLALGGTDTLNTTTLADGEHTLLIRVEDNTGKTGSSEIITVAVRNMPSVTITSPIGGAEVSGKVVLSYTATAKGTAAIDSIWLLLDGNFSKGLALGGTDTLTTTTLADGEHTLLIRVEDNTGKTGSSEIITVAVRNSPLVTITSPAGGAKVWGRIALIYENKPKKDAHIVSDSLFIDGRACASLDTGGIDSLTTTDLADGEHTIQIKVTDNNGKTGLSQLLTLLFRNTPGVTLDAPLPDASLTGTVTVKFTEAPVSPAAIVKREIYIDGGFVDTASTDSTYRWDTQNRNDGQHTIQVKVTDSNGKYGLSALVSVTVFNTPVVKITGPSGSSEISGIDTITFSVTYAPGTFRDTTELSFNGGLWIPTTDSVSYTWVSTDFLDGNHTVVVRATATNGKTGYSQVAGFKINNVPYVNIIAPVGGEALNGIYTVTFITTPVYPSTIAKRSVSIDGNAWTDSLVDSASYAMSTVGWEDGVHTIQVKAVDSRGRSGYSSQRSFIVDNAPPIAADPKAEYPDNSTAVNNNTDVLVTVLVKDVQVGLRTDSGVVLTSENIDTAAAVTCLMWDDGTSGDKVAHDNIYTSVVKVNTDTTGSVGYSITAEDKLGNAVTLTSAIRLDNTPPVISVFSLTPEPEITINPAGKRSYFEKLIVRGEYSDEGGSGLCRVFASIKNDSGNHVNNSPIDLSPRDSVFSRIINLVPGNNFISLEARDGAGNVTIRIDTVTYIEPKATMVVGKNGGTITSPNGVSAVIPQDALLKTLEITITRVLPIDQPNPIDASVRLLNVAHDFGPDGTTFRKPVTITLSYTEADLDPDQDGVNNLDPSKFIIVFWDGETWLSAGDASVDTVNRLVSVSVNHFTTFDIAQKEVIAATKLVAYWTHNPVKAASGSYFNYDIPHTGHVGLSIIDMAGDLVYQVIANKTSVEPGSYSVGWRGQNVSERFAGAGLYIYVFAYKDAVTGKTTIIRKPIGLLK